jgi:hypothetical protein
MGTEHHEHVVHAAPPDPFEHGLEEEPLLRRPEAARRPGREHDRPNPGVRHANRSVTNVPQVTVARVNQWPVRKSYATASSALRISGRARSTL